MAKCATCKKHHNHGGKCNGVTLYSSCLLYEEDERGYVEYVINNKMEIPIGYQIPPLNTFENDWECNGNPIKFDKLQPFEWDMRRGLLICKMNAYVFEKVKKENEEEKTETKVLKFKGR